MPRSVGFGPVRGPPCAARRLTESIAHHDQSSSPRAPRSPRPPSAGPPAGTVSTTRPAPTAPPDPSCTAQRATTPSKTVLEGHVVHSAAAGVMSTVDLTGQKARPLLDHHDHPSLTAAALVIRLTTRSLVTRHAEPPHRCGELFAEVLTEREQPATRGRVEQPRPIGERPESTVAGGLDGEVA